MLFRPKTTSLWDCTLIHDGKQFHLFYLGSSQLGHATSDDLVDWQEHDSIDLGGPAGTWNEEGAYLTGDVIFHDDLWHLYAGAPSAKHPSAYGLYTSPDLFDWTAYPNNPVLSAAEPHYFCKNDPDNKMLTAWRDPAIYKMDDGRYHALLCARRGPVTGNDTNAVIAHSCSDDLVHWEHHAPLAHVGDRVLFAEVPGWIEFNGRHYCYFLDLGWGGTRIHNNMQGDDLSGIYYIWSEQFEGPYQWPESPLLIGMRNNYMGPWAGRIRVHKQQALFYHHNAGNNSAFALPKEVIERAPGDLALRYLPFLDQLITKNHTDLEKQHKLRQHDLGTWQLKNEGLCGKALAMGSSAFIKDQVNNFMLEVSITIHKGAAAGIVIRAQDEEIDNAFAAKTDLGLVICLDHERQQIAIRELNHVPMHGWGSLWLQARGFSPRPHMEQASPFTIKHQQTYFLRILARDEFVEVYIDDFWILSATTTLMDAGRVECMVERSEACFADLQLNELPGL